MSSSPNDMAPDEGIVVLEPYTHQRKTVDEPHWSERWIRIGLLVLAVPWVVVFAIAIRLDPYLGVQEGEARRMGTHMQLGLPDCSFKELTGGFPCPSCGMTTSFCLLIRGDVWNSMQANFAGTILASFGLLFVPWALASAYLGRFVLIRSVEIVVFWLAIIFLVVLFGRWAAILMLEWWARSQA